MTNKTKDNDWNVIASLLPDNWENKAYQVGAFNKIRKIDSPQTLLRVLFIHLATGKSLRTTSAYAKEVELCSINDVALLKRLRASSEWLRWMSLEISKTLKITSLPEQLFNKFRVRLVDGSVVNEPGSTGTDWRIHYCILLKNLKCDSFSITSPKTSEGFHLYPVEQGDLLIGDRGYCKRKGIKYILKNKGEAMVRFHSTNLPLFNQRGNPFPILKRLKSLNETDVGDWNVWIRDPDDKNILIKGRICSIKKSKEAIEIALKKVKIKAQKRGDKSKPETIEHAKYITIFSTVNRHKLKAEEILSLYRGRWQIELVFKRFKSIIKLGHLPKKEEGSCIAWLHGKMLLALLTERLHQEAEFFSPWGYPLQSKNIYATSKEPMERI